MKINVNGKQNKKKKLIYEKERRIGVELKIKCTLCFKAKKKNGTERNGIKVNLILKAGRTTTTTTMANELNSRSLSKEKFHINCSVGKLTN